MLDDAAGEAVRRALAEDLGDAGDLTSRAVVPEGLRGEARLVARQDAILAGCAVFEFAFTEVDPSVSVSFNTKDGDRVRAGDVVAVAEGSLRSILTAERTALNFLQRLSGVATLTRAFVVAAGGVEIRDTRKTSPGLRALQKAAVRSGGGVNHRAGLYDAYLIKDNHIAAAGGVREAIARARAANPGLPLEIECETLDQVREAVDAGADELLLDNMDPPTLAEAVRIAHGKARTEASGGVTLETVGRIARAGVDAISVGALTHSAPSIDFSLEVESPDAARG